MRGRGASGGGRGSARAIPLLGVVAALVITGAAGVSCAFLSPFPDVAPDPSASGGAGGAGGAGSSEGCVPLSTRACYSGAEGTEGVGVCVGGVATCDAEGTGFGPCVGEVVPGFESCGTEADEDCDGQGCAGAHVHSEAFGDASEQRGDAIAVSGDVIAVAGHASGSVDLGGGALGELGSAGKPDAFVASFTRRAALRWGKRFSDSVIRGVAVDAGGDVVLAGGASGTVDFGGGPLTGVGNGEDVVIARLDARGQHRWSLRVGNGANQFATACAVDAGGNSVVTGVFWGKLDFGSDQALKLESKGESDGFVVKLDATGQPVWAKRFGDPEHHQAGSGVAVDGHGNVLLSGWFKGHLNLGSPDLESTGETDMFVAKLSPAGDHLWGRVAHSSNAGKALGVAVDGAGNVVVTGSFRSSIKIGPMTYTSAGDKDIFVMRLDDNGTPVWSKSFGDSADQEGVGVAVDPAGNVLVTGSFLGRIDIGGRDLSASGAADGFIAKLDPGGAPLWARSFGDSSEQGSAAIAADTLGNVWATGYFAGSTDFGGGAIQSRGANDAFVLELTP